MEPRAHCNVVSQVEHRHGTRQDETWMSTTTYEIYEAGRANVPDLQ